MLGVCVIAILLLVMLYKPYTTLADQTTHIPANQSEGTWIIQIDGEEQVLVNTLTGKKIYAALRTTDDGPEELDLAEYARMLNNEDGLTTGGSE